MAKEPKSDNSRQIDDIHASSSTVAYIGELHIKYVKAKAKLTELEARLLSLKDQKGVINDRYQRIAECQNSTRDLLHQAEQAQKHFQKILQFFQDQVQITQQLVEESHNTAESVFVSVYQLKEKAVERIERIRQLVERQVAGDGSAGNQAAVWSPVFRNTLIETDAHGIAAFKAGSVAVQNAFKAYLSNYEIHAQTTYYLQQFTQLEAELQTIIAAKRSELLLIDQQYSTLDEEEKRITTQITDCTERVEIQSFLVTQYQVAFNAAQLSAEYTYTPSEGAGF